MLFKEYKHLILSDLYRITGKIDFPTLIRELILGESYKYNFWMRTCKYTHDVRFLRITIHPISRLLLRHFRYRFGISIPYSTDIGAGFYIGHFGGIVINELATIGANCNISQGVTIGQTNRGQRMGCPTLGSNVYIGPGAKIIGAVNIGDNAAIGANAVVTKDIPPNAVAAGIPASVISYSGSTGYINKTDYPPLTKGI